ncbi:hypothetical protein HYX08_00140 [Candidatus Woesearchaeota archaeon]|nr:hypothetical protein [Candidatus Woesearchaeota archaeon]
MGKILKIILISVAIIVILFVLVLGVGLYMNYQDYKWHTEIAKNMGPVILGSSLYNEKLSSCSPSWGGQSIGESWEIRGFEKNNCIVTVKQPDMRYEEGSAYPLKIEYTGYYCKLPYSSYSNPESIDWGTFLRSEHCTTN